MSESDEVTGPEVIRESLAELKKSMASLGAVTLAENELQSKIGELKERHDKLATEEAEARAKRELKEVEARAEQQEDRNRKVDQLTARRGRLDFENVEAATAQLQDCHRNLGDRIAKILELSNRARLPESAKGLEEMIVCHRELEREIGELKTPSDREALKDWEEQYEELRWRQQMLHMETAFLDDQLSRVEMEVKYTSIDAQVEVLARTYDLTSLGRDQANILKRMVLLISQHLNVLVSQYRGELDEVERTDERSDAANIVRRLLQDLNELAEGLSSVEPGQSE